MLIHLRQLLLSIKENTMNSSQKGIFYVGLVIFFLSHLYLPYQFTSNGLSAGYQWNIELRQNKPTTLVLDEERYAYQNLALIITCGLVAYSFRKDKDFH